MPKTKFKPDQIVRAIDAISLTPIHLAGLRSRPTRAGWRRAQEFANPDTLLSRDRLARLLGGPGWPGVALVRWLSGVSAWGLGRVDAAR
jgi:hypothetical protein